MKLSARVCQNLEMETLMYGMKRVSTGEVRFIEVKSKGRRPIKEGLQDLARLALVVRNKANKLLVYDIDMTHFRC